MGTRHIRLVISQRRDRVVLLTNPKLKATGDCIHGRAGQKKGQR